MSLFTYKRHTTHFNDCEKYINFLYQKILLADFQFALFVSLLCLNFYLKPQYDLTHYN